MKIKKIIHNSGKNRKYKFFAVDQNAAAISTLEKKFQDCEQITERKVEEAAKSEAHALMLKARYF